MRPQTKINLSAQHDRINKNKQAAKTSLEFIYISEKHNYYFELEKKNEKKDTQNFVTYN